MQSAAGTTPSERVPAQPRARTLGFREIGRPHGMHHRLNAFGHRHALGIEHHIVVRGIGRRHREIALHDRVMRLIAVRDLGHHAVTLVRIKARHHALDPQLDGCADPDAHHMRDAAQQRGGAPAAQHDALGSLGGQCKNLVRGMNRDRRLIDGHAVKKAEIALQITDDVGFAQPRLVSHMVNDLVVLHTDVEHVAQAIGHVLAQRTHFTTHCDDWHRCRLSGKLQALATAA